MVEKHSECLGCRSVRFPHNGRGLCGRCYRVARRIELLRRSTPEVIVSPDLREPHYLSAGGEGLERSLADWYSRRDALIRYYQNIILSWRNVERLRRGPVSGLDLEYELRRVSDRAGEGQDIFYGLATFLIETFTPDQRVALYRLLSRIGERDDVRLDHYRLTKTTEPSVADEAIFGSSRDGC
jgi:hypothetical protein